MADSLRLLQHRAAKGDDLTSGQQAALRTYQAGKGANSAAKPMTMDEIRADVAERRRLGVNGDVPLALAAKHAASAPKSSQPRTLSSHDVQAAADRAKARERARIAEVFASPHAKGRERVCSVLLAHDANWSAAAIIKQLPTLPTDRERASGWTPEREAKASAVWAKARVNAFPKQAAADQTASGDAWDRAIAANTGESGSTAASDAWARARAQVYPEQAAKGDLWERAYASNNQAH